MINLHNACCLLIGLGFFNSVMAATEPATEGMDAAVSVSMQQAEPENTRWGMVFDNDALISATRDKDYTSGVAVNLSGKRVADYRVSLDPALTWMNKLLHVDGAGTSRQRRHLLQFGLMLFTPEIDSTGEINPGDRPFANLIFMSNAQFRVNDSGNRAYQSSLTLGMLGTGVGEAAQNAVHRAGGFSGKGEYGQQISNGGELTARYALSRQALLLSRFSDSGNSFELKYIVEGDVGYLTQGSATLAARWGRVESPWWSFAPSRSNYLPQQLPYAQGTSSASNRRDFFLWGAVTARARVYNVFLQGQFRNSELTFSSGELNHVLGELAVGATKQFGNTVGINLSVHFQTKEIKAGFGSRSTQWGSLTITKSF